MKGSAEGGSGVEEGRSLPHLYRAAPNAPWGIFLDSSPSLTFRNSLYLETCRPCSVPDFVCGIEVMGGIKHDPYPSVESKVQTNSELD